MDPDNDGVPNILEFYIDGDPLANDASNLPQPEVTDDYLVFTFNRRDDAAALALTQEFQYGSTLVDWTTVSIAPGNYAGVIVEVADGAEVDTVTVKIPRTLEVAGKLFGRLNIEMPER